MNRYQQLAASGAVAEQTLTNQQATVDSNQSSYDDANTLLQKAQENLDDTIIRAPISGKLSVDDVPSGTLCHARQHGPGIGRFDQSYLRLVLDQ